MSTLLYSQHAGMLWAKNKSEQYSLITARAYAGKDAGKNNPHLEAVKNIGPIPRGEWIISDCQAHPRLGPLALRLWPCGHTAHGRTEFFIHGDSVSRPGEASDGCIILPRGIRETIWDNHFRSLTVIW